MQETIERIVETIKFEKKDLFEKHLKKCIHISKDTHKSTYAKEENVIFHLETFFKGFSPFNNELGKDFKLEAGVEALYVILNELCVEVEKEECFILFHLRELGKFRLSEKKLRSELQELWKKYKHYNLDDSDFAYALKSLMRNDLITYRSRNLHLCSSVLIRYR
jgi:hypothetical protein